MTQPTDQSPVAELIRALEKGPKEQRDGFIATVQSGGDWASLQEWAATIGWTPDPMLGEIYDWVASQPTGGERPWEVAYGLYSPADIEENTEMWRELFEGGDEDSVWRPGMIAIHGWGSAFERLIDTNGVLGEPGRICHIDYKGGARYEITNSSLADYLRDFAEAVRQGLLLDYTACMHFLREHEAESIKQDDVIAAWREANS